MASIETIKSRIRALREMTVENGCTEAEAMAAAAKALELLRRYNLTETDIVNDRSNLGTTGRRRQVADELWPIVARICRCKGWFSSPNSPLVYVYFGRAADVAVAEYLHDLLIGAVRRATAEFRASAEYKRRRKPATRNAAVRTFQVAMVQRLIDRLTELWWAGIGESPAAAKAESRHIDQLEQESGAVLVTAGKLKGADRRMHNAAFAGFRAGDGITIAPAAPGAARAAIAGRQ